ncbi:MAG: hypothetical protein RLZZ464_535 [Pseudomonadota bacterium]|jgi:hypothetical protein
MGGFGSGRKSGKQTTGDMWRLDVRCLARGGYLKPGMAFRWHWQSDGETVASINLTVQVGQVWLHYKHRERGKEWEDMCYPVSLDVTKCHMGGQRVWWLCPALGCGRRVALLYGGKMYACRDCHRLAYQCQREVDYDRATRRADNIRNRLGWDSGSFSGAGIKPKGMHFRTFESLRDALDAFSNRALESLLRHLK